MYLFVLTLLMMALLGLYTEIYALQATSMFAEQKGIAKMMMAWQGQAVDMARANRAAIAPDATGCSLSFPSGPPGPPGCGGVVMSAAAFPAGYGYTGYTWNTIVYQPAGSVSPYVITFAAPPAAGSADPVVMPRVGLSTSELLQQIRRTRQSGALYGSVIRNAANAIVLRTADATQELALPGNANISNNMPLGTVFLISVY